MNSLMFDDGVRKLQFAINETIIRHFKENNIPFNLDAYISQTDIDANLAVQELYFLGAEVFPSDTD